MPRGEILKQGVNSMNEITIKCEYAYDGNASNTTYENHTLGKKEEWEIIPFKKEPECYITVRNIDQGFSETIKISEAMYERIVLGYEQDIATYLKIVYETCPGKKAVKSISQLKPRGGSKPHREQ
jgi:hypothetical protein